MPERRKLEGAPGSRLRPQTAGMSSIVSKLMAILGGDPQQESSLEGWWGDLKQQILATAGQTPALNKLFGADPYGDAVDGKYLEQFLHPKRDVFPLQPLRPTQVSQVPNIPFRDIGPLALDADTRPLIARDGTVRAETPLVENVRGDMRGLGHVTQSVGHDASGEPYYSIYDTWDFDSPTIGKMTGKILNQTGTPYALYGRYPLEEDMLTDDEVRWRGLGPADRKYRFKKDR